MAKDTTDYLYDRESGLPMLVDDETNAYLHDGGTLATIDGSDDALYLLDDALGSVRGITDEAGDVDGTADYNVYGEVRASSGVSMLFRFTGEQHDPETGFTYLRARYANPALGRFVSADTVQPNAPGTQGYNPYAYVANNPTSWTDPSGHSASASRALMSIYLANPGIMTTLVGTCAGLAGVAVAANSVRPNGNGTLTRSSPLGGVAAGVCLNAVFVGVTIPLLACALDPGCFLAALEDAGHIGDLGSFGPSDFPLDLDKLKDAWKWWPWIPAIPLAPLLQDALDEVDLSSPGSSGDDDCMKYWVHCRENPLDWTFEGDSFCRDCYSDCLRVGKWDEERCKPPTKFYFTSSRAPIFTAGVAGSPALAGCGA